MFSFIKQLPKHQLSNTIRMNFGMHYHPSNSWEVTKLPSTIVDRKDGKLYKAGDESEFRQKYYDFPNDYHPTRLNYHKDGFLAISLSFVLSSWYYYEKSYLIRTGRKQRDRTKPVYRR